MANGQTDNLTHSLYETADVTVPLYSDTRMEETPQDQLSLNIENKQNKGTQTNDDYSSNYDYECPKHRVKSRRRRVAIGIGVGLTSLLIVTTAICITIVILDDRNAPKSARITQMNYSQLCPSSYGLSGVNDSDSAPDNSLTMISSPFSDCGSQDGSIIAYFTETCQVEGDRCRFNRYETGMLEIVFTLQKPVNQLTASACGKLDIPLLNLVCIDQEVEPTDVCASLHCPLQPNRIYRYRLRQKSPTSMLNMISGLRDVRSAINYRLRDETGSNAICLNMAMILT